MQENNPVTGNLAVAEKQRVIVIDAREKPQDIKLRVAAYARVSTDSEDQLNSFAAQNRYYTTLIDSNCLSGSVPNVLAKSLCRRGQRPRRCFGNW